MPLDAVRPEPAVALGVAQEVDEPPARRGERTVVLPAPRSSVHTVLSAAEFAQLASGLPDPATVPAVFHENGRAPARSGRVVPVVMGFLAGVLAGLLLASV